VATYFTDFSEYSDGSLPSDWTERWDASSNFTKNSSGYLQAAISSNNRDICTWNDIDSDSNRAEVEVLVKFKTKSVTTDTANAGVVLRASGTSTTETGYVVHNYGNDIRVARYANATLTSLEVANLSLAADTWYWLRAKASGTGATVTITYKVWADGGSESSPLVSDSYDDTATERITAAGWVGVYAFTATGDGDWDQFGVGTNGDAAPSSGTATTTAAVTGVSSTGSVGTVTTTYSGSVTVTGVTSTGSVGTVTTTYSGSTTVTGVSSTTAVGSVTVSTGVNASVTVAGVSSTSAVGSVTCNYDYTYYVPVNLLTYSEDFTNASWTELRATKSTGQTGPDGLSTAVKVVEDTTSANTHYIYKINANAVISGYPTSASIYAKKGERSLLVIVVRDLSSVNGFGYEFNLDAGTVAQRVLYGNGQYLQGTIEAVGGGWYRCTATGYYSSSDTSERTLYLLEETANTFNYNGDGSSGLYLWGGQLEKSSAASPYIKTESTSASYNKITSSVGTVSHIISPNVSVSGVSTTGSAGTVTVSTANVINVSVSGVSCNTSVGAVSCNYDYVHTVTGVVVNGRVGNVTILGAEVSVTNWDEITQATSIWSDKAQATSTWDDITQINSTWTEV
jgi:hypothetical protein